MKRIIITIAISATCLVAFNVKAQTHTLSSKPRMFFSAGFVTPQFFGGTELNNAYDFRKAGLSYYQTMIAVEHRRWKLRHQHWLLLRV
jgi:hypothetical protein